MNKFAIELLIKQRQLLIARKVAMMNEINLEISDIESGIERLSGKKVWEMEGAIQYDDEHPDYIKESIES